MSAFPIGGGVTGDLIRAFDWGATVLGPIAAWPDRLRGAVQTLLLSPIPMVAICGPEGILVYNDGYAEVCGPRHPAALGAPLLTAWPEARDFNAHVLAEGLAGRSLSFVAQELELRRHGRPERVWMDLEYSPVLDADGRAIAVIAVVLDITRRIVTERELADGAARFRFLDRLSEATAEARNAGEVLAVTTRLVGEHAGVSICAYADMDPDEDGFTIRGDWHAEGSASIVGHYRLTDFGERAARELHEGRPFVVDDVERDLPPHEARTFRSIGVSATICMPLVKGGRLVALMAIHHRDPHAWTPGELALIRDVTERCWAHIERVGVEANLRASEEQLRFATEAAEIGLWDVDEIAHTLYWPPRLKAMFGISPHVPISMADFVAGLHPEDRDDTLAAYQAATDPSRRALYDVEYRTVGAEDGIVRWIAAKGRAIFVGDRCVRVVGTAIDITRRKATEQALHELNDTLERRIAEALAERKLFADLVEGTDAFVQVVGMDFRWLAINRASADEFESIFGIRPRAGDSMLECLADQPEHQAAVRAVWSRVLGGEQFTEIGEFGATRRRYYEMKYNVLRDADGRQIGAYQFCYDVTARVSEQRRLAEAEEQLRQAQKMEAMGQLTGGVAHDFNNLLTPIIGSLDLLQRRAHGDDRERRLIDGALQSAERAKTLVQRLLAFARRQPLQPTAVDVRALVHGMAELLASSAGPQVRVAVEIGDALPSARGDVNQLEMALLNLGVNARDAMPSGGTLRITADRVRDEGHGDLAPGDYVRISVADTGTGMDAATLARAVEPFFSTKGIGKGTGLGLSMVHGLAQQLGGTLRMHSVPGVGTNVELWLPVSDGTALPRERAPEPVRAPARGRVLLVDDEDVVRASTAHMLGDLGYDVSEARSAEEALRMLDTTPAPDLLVTDHLMPGMNGTDLVRLARERAPRLRSLIISGYADVEGIAPDLPRLAKPFRSAELAAKLEALAR